MSGNVGNPERRLVTVCDACLTAACWNGEFMCENARWAGTREMTVEELTELAREHSSHWNRPWNQ